MVIKKFLILINYGYLKKALYGLKQAGRMWYNEISHYLVSIGFRKYKTDKCLFRKYNKNKFKKIILNY